MTTSSAFVAHVGEPAQGFHELGVFEAFGLQHGEGGVRGNLCLLGGCGGRGRRRDRRGDQEHEEAQRKAPSPGTHLGWIAGHYPIPTPQEGRPKRDVRGHGRPVLQGTVGGPPVCCKRAGRLGSEWPLGTNCPQSRAFVRHFGRLVADKAARSGPAGKNCPFRPGRCSLRAAMRRSPRTFPGRDPAPPSCHPRGR